MSQNKDKEFKKKYDVTGMVEVRGRRWWTITTEPPILVVNTVKNLLGPIRMNVLPPVTAIGAEETEWEKKHLAVTDQNELRKEVVRYDMPTWEREKKYKTKKGCQIKREIPASTIYNQLSQIILDKGFYNFSAPMWPNKDTYWKKKNKKKTVSVR